MIPIFNGVGRRKGKVLVDTQNRGAEKWGDWFVQVICLLFAGFILFNCYAVMRASDLQKLLRGTSYYRLNTVAASDTCT